MNPKRRLAPEKARGTALEDKAAEFTVFFS